MNRKLLLVDDEANVIAALIRALLDEPYEVLTALSGEEALEIMRQSRPQVVVSDERMPGMGGAEFLTTVKLRYPETIRMMLTGHASMESTMKAVNSGEIYRFFTKPWNDLELRLALRSAFEKYDLEAENRRLLQTVKRQSQELRSLESRYPGICEIEKDEAGSYLLPEMSDEEVMDIIQRYSEELEE